MDCPVKVGLETGTKYSQMLRMVQNLDIMVHIQLPDEDVPVSREESMSHRCDVAELAKPLKLLVSLQNLAITVVNQVPIDDDNDIGNNILSSLKAVRTMKRVTINGVSSTHAKEIKEAMESEEPVEDLHAMLDRVSDYLEPNPLADPNWIEMVDAVGAWDHESFKRARQAMVTRVEDEEIARRRRLFLDDFAWRDDGHCYGRRQENPAHIPIPT